MTDYQAISFSVDQRVATITFNRPDSANGLNLQMASEFATAAQACADNVDLKAVVVTGSGKFFCAGGDVKGMQEHPESPGIAVKQIADQLHKALLVLADSDLPVITAVNGTAAGAGFSIAISADIAIVAESAKFTMAYSKIALSPDGSSSYYLPRLVGLRKAQELMFTNRVLNAQDALEWGLINKVVSDESLLDEAQTLAKIFVNGSKGSNAAIKALLRASNHNDLEAQLALESSTIAACADSEDGREGVNSFVEKRKPIYS